MDTTKLNPMDQLIFKQLFCTVESKSNLLNLLNSILNLDENSKINNIYKIENKQIGEECISGKRWVLSVSSKTVCNKNIDIEIQLTDNKGIVDVALFCLSKLHVELNGEKDNFKKSIVIIFLDYEYFPCKEFHTVYHFREDKNNDYMLSDNLELHFIELPKFSKMKTVIDNSLHRWMLFLDTTTSEETLSNIKKIDNDIKKICERLEEIALNKDFIDIYNAREKILTEYHQLISEAEYRGKKIGLEVGRKEGIDTGIIATYKEVIVEVLRDYGTVSKEIRELVRDNSNIDSLKEWYTIARFVNGGNEFIEQISL